ncbi:MAG TPA: META domain-containing protein [Arenibacter sp.]|nr:META domain-containing protein [Arenibacter sp.]
MKKSILPIILIAFGAVSCNTQKKIASDTAPNDNNELVMDAELTGTRWVLSELEGKKVDENATQQRDIHFTLNGNDNTLNGFFGCNVANGSFSLEEGNRIRFSRIATTRMACPDATINEFEVLDALNLVDNYTLQGSTLTLNKGRRAPLAVFIKEVVGNDPITEKYWKLKTLEGKEVKMADNQEREAYFMLKGADNRITGFSGCNGFSGTYNLENGNRISFSRIAMTMKACPDVDLNESEFLKIFELADNYTVNGDTLMLNVGKRAPLAVFEAVYFK